MRHPSIVNESRQIEIAMSLIRLGARLQVLESETRISRERLLRLYKEMVGKSPPKGMLPFSTDWFMTWQPNIHSSLFINIYQGLLKGSDLAGIEAVIKAFELYIEHLAAHSLPRVLSITRAWRLVKFFEAHMLQTAPCTQCGGLFVVHANDLYERFVCGLCHVPSRAGKTRKPRLLSSSHAH
jgi:flagellar transcriptional activator FlhC